MGAPDEAGGVDGAAVVLGADEDPAAAETLPAGGGVAPGAVIAPAGAVGGGAAEPAGCESAAPATPRMSAKLDAVRILRERIPALFLLRGRPVSAPPTRAPCRR